MWKSKNNINGAKLTSARNPHNIPRTKSPFSLVSLYCIKCRSVLLKKKNPAVPINTGANINTIHSIMNPSQFESSKLKSSMERLKSSIDMMKLNMMDSNGAMQANIMKSYMTKRIKFTFSCVSSYSSKWCFPFFRAEFPIHTGTNNNARNTDLIEGRWMSEKTD